MKVLHKFKAHPTQDGAGVNISRIHDFNGRYLDPFLMIDELKSNNENDFIGGFPPHPHRGIETFTYMIKGGFEHQDHMGNKKVISDGDVQWMSTGYGVIHSEMPVSNQGMHGFQIWLNMPAKDKLRPAQYADSSGSNLPTLALGNNSKLTLLGGSLAINQQRLTSHVGPLAASGAIADLSLSQNDTISVNVSGKQMLALFVHTGEIESGDERLAAGELALLDANEPINLSALQQSGVLLLAGVPLNEPIAHMGPFVMNTQAELKQAVLDYQQGKFGVIA